MALFTVAEARAFDRGQLADATVYPDAAISAQADSIARQFRDITGRDWVPTQYVEYADGSGKALLTLEHWPVASVSAVSIYESGAWTALTADELAQVEPVREVGIIRRGGVWPPGSHNVQVTYVAGEEVVPAPIKRAALLLCVEQLAKSNLTGRETSYSDGTLSYQLATPGANWGWWTGVPEVNAILAQYTGSAVR